MSIQNPVHVSSGLPGRIATLALAAGLGIVVGAGIAPYSSSNGTRGEADAVQSVSSSPQIIDSSEAAMRANEARLELVLNAEKLVALARSPEGEIIVLGTSAERMP